MCNLANLDAAVGDGLMEVIKVRPTRRHSSPGSKP
jgi:hypothetical protein